MTKAIISNRIYMNMPDKETYDHIAKTLTYKIYQETGKKHFSNIETIKNYKLVNKNVVSIPQGRQDLIPEDYEVVDKRIFVPAPFPETKFALREAQLPIYEAVTDTCFINALVGWGKTFTALHIAKKLGQKTLVITHTTALRDQWCEEVETLFDMPCGIIGSGNIDYEDHAIVISNIQTLVKHCDQLAKEFGTIILDEAHHCPATTFSKVVDTFHARYRIALSGTMHRKDKKHVVFPDYFGHQVFKPPQSDTLTPRVHLVNTNITLKPNAPWTDKITELCNSVNYQKFIAAVALDKMSEGHQVLIIADRVEFLENIKLYIGDSCVAITGNTDFELRQKYKEQLLSKELMAVCGSRQIFSEGISINSLSCVILAVPISNDSLLEQIIGRIQRQHPNKLDPLVIDMQFQGWADKKQNRDRFGFYIGKGWQTEKI